MAHLLPVLGVVEGGQGQGYRRCTGLKLGFPGKLDVLSADESRRSIPSSALEVRVGCPLRGGGGGMKRQVQLSMIGREHGRAAMWNEAAIPTLLAEASCAAIAPLLFQMYCPQSPPRG